MRPDSKLLLRAATLLRPSDDLLPDQWADRNREFPPTAGKPGRWSTADAAYTRGPMRAAASPRWDRCGFVISSQNGKTQTAINIALCRIDQEPTKVLYIGPTRDNVSTVISPKVDQAIRLSPAMDAKAHYGQSWTKTLMPIAGVSFRLAWAGSPIQIAADDACIVLIDEVDRTDRDIRGEGSIIELGDGRHGSYIDGKTIVFSTPTEGFVTTEVDDRTGLEHWARAEPDALNSQMWEFWQDGTRHEYAIPCSACRTYFIPRLSRLFIPEGATPIQARKEARLCCPICEHGMTSEEVFEWGRKGVYLAPGQRAFLEDGDDVKAVLVEDMTVKPSLLEDVEFGDYMAPAVEETSDATFWCSGLISYSRKNSIARLAEAITKARRTTDPNRIKTVTNTKFAEPYAPPGERREWRTVHNCRAEYRLGDFPQEVGNRIAVATMGVDVQKLFLTWVVRLWTEGNNSWLLARGELNGETDQPEVWRALGQLLRRTYGGVPIY
ncbi:MAG: terminase gpA endonuclease subunit, partial [Solirubrobacterales bacterium]